MTTTISVGASIMNCTCEREDLLRHLQTTARGVSTRTSIQVLSGIQIVARGGELHLAATDMEVSVRTRLASQIEQEGVAIVPGKLFVDIVRLLNGSRVTLTARDNMLTIQSDQSTYTLNTFDPEDFPQLPATTGALFSVDSGAFVQTVQSVSRAASSDESRPVLTGVQVKVTESLLTMVATDSYRLSVKDAPITCEVAEAMEAIVPARALDELVKIADASPAALLSIAFESNQVLFGIDETWVTARKIEGQFPNYSQLIPQTFEHDATIDRADLLDVVNRTRLMAQRNSPLRLSFSEGSMTISATTQDVGAAEETLAVAFSGEELTIGLNADFLRDGVQSFDGDTITLSLTNPLRPGLLRSPDSTLQYLIMPVRLPE